MRRRLASRRMSSKRQRDIEESHIITSSREASIEPRSNPAAKIDPVNSLQNTAPDIVPHRIPSDTRQIEKRRRLYTPVASNRHKIEPRQERLSTKQHCPESTLRDIKCSFVAYRSLSDYSSLPTCNTSAPALGGLDGTVGVGFVERVMGHVKGSTYGIQADPIAVSDACSICTDDIEDGGNGSLFLEEVPEVEDFLDSDNTSSGGQDTQLSLSTTAFESQGSHSSAGRTDRANVQYRKEAYKAAREFGDSWKVERNLVSCLPSHCEEETEL